MYLLAYSYTEILKSCHFGLKDPMLRVKDPVIVGKPPRKLASTFRPDSGHFSVQNAAPIVACIGAVTVNTNKDGIDVPLLTPEMK